MEIDKRTQSDKREYLPTDELDALAVKAKDDKDAALRLWHEVERFVDMVTGKRYHWVSSTVLEFEDIRQCAYFGFVHALKYFKPEKGHFLTALDFGIRRACNQEYKRMCEIPVTITSLDIPIRNSDGDDGGSIVDFMIDETVEAAIDMIADKDLVQSILGEAEKLKNPMMARIVRECVCGERSEESFADECGVSRAAINALKKRR